MFNFTLYPGQILNYTKPKTNNRDSNCQGFFFFFYAHTWNNLIFQTLTTLVFYHWGKDQHNCMRRGQFCHFKENFFCSVQLEIWTELSKSWTFVHMGNKSDQLLPNFLKSININWIKDIFEIEHVFYFIFFLKIWSCHSYVMDYIYIISQACFNEENIIFKLLEINKYSSRSSYFPLLGRKKNGVRAVEAFYN